MAVRAAFAIIEVGALLRAVDKIYALALSVRFAAAHGLFGERPQRVRLGPADATVAAAIASSAEVI